MGGRRRAGGCWCSADGGSRGNPGPAGYGAVVTDTATGEVLAEAAEAIGVATNNVAEYRGLLAGLRAAAAIDPGAAVEVAMDSKLVVEQMSGRWKVKHPDMAALAREARAVLPAGAVTYRWVPRAQNAHADALANEAMDAAAAGRAWRPPAASAGDDGAAPATTSARGAASAGGHGGGDAVDAHHPPRRGPARRSAAATSTPSARGSCSRWTRARCWWTCAPPPS